MARAAKLWRRKGRGGWWATIGGKQVCLGDDHAEATRELHRLKAAVKPPPPSKVVVAQLVDQYLEWVEPRVRPKTYRAYSTYLQSWVLSAGRVVADAIRESHVHGWLDAHANWGQSSRHIALGILRAWASWCETHGYRIRSEIAKVKKPPMARRRPPNPGALDATLAAILTPEFRDFATVLLDIGCRPGELRTLEASGIDWEASTAWVSGKTGRRLVGLTTRAVDILRRWAAKHPAGPVLRNSRGQPWGERAIDAQFRRRSRAAGKGACVAYHLRHAFWGRAVRAGVDSLLIAKQLGHANTAMLSKHYADVQPEMIRDAAERASQPSNGKPQ
jgi:integrase